MRSNLDSLSCEDAVYRVLEQHGGPMRARQIVKWFEESGQKPLRKAQVNTALETLRKSGTVEHVRWRRWRVVRVSEEKARVEHTDNQLDVTGLTSKEAVFRVLAHIKSPMKTKDIVDWLKANGGEQLRDNQVSGALYDLSTLYLDVVEKVEPGTYRIHPDWDGDTLDKQKRKSDPSSTAVEQQRSGRRAPGRNSDRKIVIPCFGLHWERSLVSWNGGQGLLGAVKDGEEAVDFANQTGVYVLYQWPQVNYVGRTTNGGLYQRLKSHDADRRKGLWDKFSWFGLHEVDDDGQLRAAPTARRNVPAEIMMMEALLISVLMPPHNSKRGDGMGFQYFQVPDPMIEEREGKILAEKISRLLLSKERSSFTPGNR